MRPKEKCEQESNFKMTLWPIKANNFSLVTGALGTRAQLHLIPELLVSGLLPLADRISNTNLLEQLIVYAIRDHKGHLPLFKKYKNQLEEKVRRRFSAAAIHQVLIPKQNSNEVKDPGFSKAESLKFLPSPLRVLHKLLSTKNSLEVWRLEVRRDKFSLKFNTTSKK